MAFGTYSGGGFGFGYGGIETGGIGYPYFYTPPYVEVPQFDDVGVAGPGPTPDGTPDPIPDPVETKPDTTVPGDEGDIGMGQRPPDLPEIIVQRPEDDPIDPEPDKLPTGQPPTRPETKVPPPIIAVGRPHEPRPLNFTGIGPGAQLIAQLLTSSKKKLRGGVVFPPVTTGTALGRFGGS
jgi:hypothetical protein